MWWHNNTNGESSLYLNIKWHKVLVYLDIAYLNTIIYWLTLRISLESAVWVSTTPRPTLKDNSLIVSETWQMKRYSSQSYIQKISITALLSIACSKGIGRLVTTWLFYLRKTFISVSDFHDILYNVKFGFLLRMFLVTRQYLWFFSQLLLQCCRH